MSASYLEDREEEEEDNEQESISTIKKNAKKKKLQGLTFCLLNNKNNDLI